MDGIAGMITVFHLNHDLDRKKRHGVIFPLLIGDDETPRAVAAKQLFEEGGYHEAAKVEGTDLNYAFRVTNNLENSWSLEPVAGVTPTAPGFEEFKGKQYGYKSSEIGDIFRVEETGKMYVVDTFGFTELP